MNVGIEIPVRTKTVAPRSNRLRGRRAASTPTLIPSNIQMTAAPTASETSMGSACAMIVVTGSRLLFEMPRWIVRPGVVQNEDEGDDHPERDQPQDDTADEEAGHAGFRFLRAAKIRSVRGSSASRMASPRRLNDSVVMSRKSIGKI